MTDEQIVDIFLNELVGQIRNLVRTGFSVRSAVAVGPMCTEKLLFGPALVDAVQLEKEAVFPRVLLSESVIKYISVTTACSNLVLQDSNGRALLHYLGGMSGFAHMKLHRDYVQNGLNENSNRAMSDRSMTGLLNTTTSSQTIGEEASLRYLSISLLGLQRNLGPYSQAI